jgi:hypothetical protein
VKRDEKPTAADHAKLKSLLQKHGVSAKGASDAVGAAVGDQTCADVAEKLKGFLRSAPKQKGK